ncbi:tetraacyldisaccharide 4'-kinase [Gallaecimonas kandeliae]|uniref:tetraacyldisaccharide 4'-kinase n=1 Tax=Gallaecimonas kandeliae TaxID=3029055 RepID=UPI0026471BAF|nr:tetraacyldisaccharide 4'-kinase [Gallaecimonas kandeliae]WKE67049.1 tetraacyldisaccharide 4'-kinase [Gallaecimonas kandeliae]
MDFWYQKAGWQAWLLSPLTGLFWLVSALRRLLFRLGLKKVYRAPVPVIIVGNLSVGGNGKTPVVLALAESLKEAGLKPGLIARGYGAKGPFPALVKADSPAAAVGDEARLLAKRSGLPMAVGPDRRAAIELLLADQDVDVIISDDGLQHYALSRDIEIVVMDGERRLGNGWLLPSGPLREGAWRLDKVDFVVVNGGMAGPGQYAMTLNQGLPKRVADDVELPWEQLPARVKAAAGIGNPGRFFASLAQRGLELERRLAFADHHAFSAADFAGVEGTLLMTEKDAVKCQPFAADSWYYVPVEAAFGPNLGEALLEILRSRHGL